MAFASDTLPADAQAADTGVRGNEGLQAGLGVEAAAPTASGVTVHRAQRLEDLVEVRDIVLEYHGESRYAHLPFSERKFIRNFEKAMSRPNDTLSLYVKYNDKTVAVLNATAGDYYLGEGGRLVTVYAMYVSRSIRHTALGGRIGLKIMRAAIEWAKSQKALEVHVHSTSGIAPERTDKFLRRLGYTTYGGNYALNLA